MLNYQRVNNLHVGKCPLPCVSFPRVSVDTETGQQGRVFPKWVQFGNKTSKNAFLAEMLRPRHVLSYGWLEDSGWKILYWQSSFGWISFQSDFFQQDLVLQFISCYLDSRLNMNSWVRVKLQKSGRVLDSKSWSFEVSILTPDFPYPLFIG